MAWKYSSPSGTNPSRQIPRPGMAGIYTTLATTQGTPIEQSVPKEKGGGYEHPQQTLRTRLPLIMIGAVSLIAALVWLSGMLT